MVVSLYNMMQETVISAYGMGTGACIQPFGKGLINRTWQVQDAGHDYILQQINTRVFADPSLIADNLELIGTYLEKNHPGYFLPLPVKTKQGSNMVRSGGHYYRLFPFVKDSVNIDVVENVGQAYEAARQFGLFTSRLSGLELHRLKLPLPSFHDLAKRYTQFEQVCVNGNTERIREAQKEIGILREHASIVSQYQALIGSGEFPLRATHHDTKISNVLFDRRGKGICVIDLDTVMPGYFFSDTGDMMRTYLSPVNEEEKDLSAICVRDDYFRAIVEGYFSVMKDKLTGAEREHFVFAGIFMTYMQALRFLTDHLNNDRYYGASYEGHNYVRARNQLVLLKGIMEKERVLRKMVSAL